MERFEELERKLAGHRLLKEWGREDLKKLIEEDTAPTDEAPDPRATPGTAQSWEDRAKRERDAGDLAVALESAWHAIHSEGKNHVRLYLELVQMMAARSAAPRDQAIIHVNINGFP